MSGPPASSVFVNCPFDDQYRTLFRALVFAIHDCGFVARSALEISDATRNRFLKIVDLIAECRYGIHDISRTEPGRHGLPRFNMPLELGVFLGCKAFGGGEHRAKACLILDRTPYRYQRFISDISGQDVVSHGGTVSGIIRQTRNWLTTQSRRSGIPGGATIAKRYATFKRRLPRLLRRVKLRDDEMTFFDYTNIVVQWLEVNAA